MVCLHRTTIRKLREELNATNFVPLGVLKAEKTLKLCSDPHQKIFISVHSLSPIKSQFEFTHERDGRLTSFLTTTDRKTSRGNYEGDN